MPLHARLFLALGALSAALAVALGAAANHALTERLANTLPWFQTALLYQQFHALGLILVGLVATRLPTSRWVVAAGWLMFAGSVLFSGNLYLRSLMNFHVLHAVTPFGGAALILAWLSLALGAMTAGNAVKG